MRTEKVSVLMAVYNEELRWLDAAVRSILTQTHRELEFIIVLDNPRQFEIKAYLQELEKEDSRIKLIFNVENKGLVESLNTALLLASGEYIARMDADDISLPTRLEESLTFLKENQLDMVGTRLAKIDEDGTILSVQNESEISESLFLILEKQINIVPHPTWLVKRKVFLRNQGYRHFFAMEDYDFVLRAIEAGYRIHILPKVLLHYRVRTNSITQSNEYVQFMNAMILHKHQRIGSLEMLTIDDFYTKEKLPSIKKQIRYKKIISHAQGIGSGGLRKYLSIWLVIWDIVCFAEAREKLRTKKALKRFEDLIVSTKNR